MTENIDREKILDLIPEPYRSMCEKSFWAGYVCGMQEDWKDPYYYGPGWTAGTMFRLWEIYYDLNGGWLTTKDIEAVMDRERRL